ncbi:recombinase zinc beta ribbon domain-containing protein [Nocardia puris]|uniref:recombinase zinc beta ribbon domain-containing protein n=1 Tax=Nocardia puris TaxID=208602 RepID=UPI0012F4A7B2|nr:recombinase zinc beta ribbon domain-containing protein [Nocardia puris]
MQDVLNFRSGRGQRDRVLTHYLKGALFCQRCHKAGRTARLIYTEPQGRGGVRYAYFLCRGRQEGLCDLPHLRAELVEEAITDYYATLQLPADFATEVLRLLDDTVQDQQATTREHHASLTRQLKQIDDKESRLIDLAADGTMPQVKIKTKLNELRMERDRVEAGLASTGEELAVGAALLRDALHLLEDPQRMYRDAPDTIRRHLNQAFYERFYLDDLEVADDQKTPLFTELHTAKRTHGRRQIRTARCGQRQPEQQEGPRQTEARTNENGPTLASVLSVTGLSKAAMVGLTGFEPATT